MNPINRLASGACDLLLLPFRSLPPIWGLLWLSLLTTLIVLVGYRLLSRPARIRAAKESIKANILAIRLYKDFWRVVGGSFLHSLFHTARYFALNLLPLLVMLPLLVPLFVQMDVRYGMRPFRPGEAVVVKALFNRDIAGLDIRLTSGTGWRPAMKPVFIPALREVNWKLRAVTADETPLQVAVNGRIATKTLLVGDQTVALSNARLRAAGSAWLDRLGAPREAPLTDPPELQAVTIRYPACTVSGLGLHLHWLLWYVAIVLLLALALKKRFGVEF